MNSLSLSAFKCSLISIASSFADITILYRAEPSQQRSANWHRRKDGDFDFSLKPWCLVIIRIKENCLENKNTYSIVVAFSLMCMLMCHVFDIVPALNLCSFVLSWCPVQAAYSLVLSSCHIWEWQTVTLSLADMRNIVQFHKASCHFLWTSVILWVLAAMYCRFGLILTLFFLAVLLSMIHLGIIL